MLESLNVLNLRPIPKNGSANIIASNTDFITVAPAHKHIISTDKDVVDAPRSMNEKIWRENPLKLVKLYNPYFSSN